MHKTDVLRLWDRGRQSVSRFTPAFDDGDEVQPNAPTTWVLLAAIFPVLLWAVINAPPFAQKFASLLAAAATLEIVAPDMLRFGRRVVGPAFCIAVAGYMLFGAPTVVLIGCARGIVRAVHRRTPPMIAATAITWSILGPLFAALAAGLATHYWPKPTGILVFVAATFVLELVAASARISNVVGLLPTDAWKGFFPWAPLQYAAFGAVGYLLSRELDAGNLVVLFYLAVPFAILRASFGASGWGTDRYIAALERENDALLNRMGQFDRTNGDLIEALAVAIDEQEGAERGRSRRIAQIATRIGSALGITGWDLEILRRAALLHDVGILAVPSGSEQTPLHCELGARLVARWRDGRTITRVIEQHHERMDGSGFPRGLTGDAIILEARIVAVAETFVQLTSGPRNVGTLEALRDIESRSGTEFDAQVVETLAQAVEPRTADVLPMTRRR